MKRTILGILAIIGVIFLLANCTTEPPYTVDQIDVRAQVLKDGDLYIEELYTITYEGEFNNASRKLELVGHEGVEFFEAYIPPQGKALGEFSYDDSERLNVNYHYKMNTYFTDIKGTKETITLYYRYRLDQVASRFHDTGQLDWNFIYSNDTDFHNVKIEVYFPEAFEPKEVEMFAHNRNGGDFTTTSNWSVMYKTDFVSEYEDLKLHFLFPESFLSESKMKKAVLTKEQRIQKELDREKRYIKRESRFVTAEERVKLFNYILVVIIVILLIPFQAIIGKWKARNISYEQIEQLSPVLLMLYYRKGQLLLKDFLAGVFSIHQTGLFKISRRPSNHRFQQDPSAPKETIAFSASGKRTNYSGSNYHIVKWLFRLVPSGVREFSLSSISGPTKIERRNKQALSQYHHTVKKFHDQFKEWTTLVDEEYNTSSIFKKNQWMKWLLIPSMIFHYVLVMYFYMIDAKSSTMIALATIILGGGLFLVAKYHQFKRSFIIYLIACNFFGVQIHNEIVSDLYFTTTALSLVIIFIFPRVTLTLEGATHREAVRKWRKLLKKGAYSVKSDPSRVHTFIHHALLLGVSKSFIQKFKQNYPAEISDSIRPLFDESTEKLIQYTCESLQEIPEVTQKSKSRGYHSTSDSGSGWDWSSSSNTDGGGSSDGGGGGD